MGRVSADFPTSVWEGDSATRTVTEAAGASQAPDYADWDRITAEVIAAQQEVADNREMVVPNGQGAALPEGSPVYMLANGNGAVKADCNGTPPARDVIGIVKVGQAASGGNVTVQVAGRITLTTAQWDAITSGSGGLVANKIYFLSGTAGALTLTKPATTGDNIVSMILALSTTQAMIINRFSGVA